MRTFDFETGVMSTKTDEKKTTLRKAEALRERRLYKSRDDKILDGVLAGVADYFSIDPTLVRVVGVLMLLAQPGGFILFYIVAMIIVPESPRDEKEATGTHSDRIAHSFDRLETEGNKLFGGILIVLGIMFLFKNFFDWIIWDFMWPVLVILIGIYMIVRR